MYDFYPEWGPAHLRDEDDRPAERRPRYWNATPVAAGADTSRDGSAGRPDDN